MTTPKIALVVEDNYGNALITRVPINNRSIIVRVRSVDDVKFVKVRDKKCWDSLVSLEDYNK